MADPVVIPASELPTTTAPNPAAPLPPEIAYLHQHGLESEAGSLQAELEGLLQARDAGTPTPTVAPITQTQPLPVDSATLLPVTPSPLDPYAVDGATSEHEDVQSVVIDDQGRTRDAKTGKYVPVQALHAERTKTKELRSELQTTREQNARVEERLAILNEILSAEEQAPPAVAGPVIPPVVEEIVDPEVDIFKFSKQMLERAKRQDDYIKKLEEKISGSEQMSRAQIEAMQTDQTIRSDVTSFYAKTPDFLQAYNHLRSTRDNALKALGFADDGARNAQIAREEKALATDAIKNKKSYAQTIYNLAKAYGYAQVPVTPPAPPPSPMVPVAAAPVQPVIDPVAAAKIESIRNGKDLASATLNGAGGSAGEGLTVQALANMSESDFIDLAGKLGKAKLDKLLRGV